MASGPLTAGAGAGRSRPQEVDRHVGANVRERRLALGLTQQQLAELIGTTYQQAHKYERGVNRISAGRLHVIAGALGVEPGYFFGDLGGDGPARPSAGQQRLLELSRSFVALSRPHREVVAGLARARRGGRRAGGGRGEGGLRRTAGAPPDRSPERALARCRCS